jgi:UDP-N-acetylglucosamine 2-epimerase
MGTRPEVIKMAPVYHALRGSGLEPVVLHTGQHDEMAWPAYEFFDMQPEYAVHLTRERPSLGHLGGRLMDEVDAVIGRAEATAMLVHGDTSSALMAAIAGTYSKLPVGHVEAGLRSGDPENPFPEETNRILIGRIARWHFAPTERAVKNLEREAIGPAGVHMVGNTIVDATRLGMDYAIQHYTGNGGGASCEVAPFVERAGADGKLILVTAHRRENWGAPIARIARTIRELMESHGDLHVVWPVHPNPLVRDEIVAVMRNLAPDVRDRLLMTGPLDYPQMLWTMRHAWLGITDSGGIQEEAASLRTPVLVTRTTTERPEIIEAGGGVLVGTDSGTLRRWVENLLDRPRLHERMRSIDNPFGDGDAASNIADVLIRDLATGADTQRSVAA